MAQSLYALDVRLVSTRNTGDTSYWRGLLRGLEKVSDPDSRFLLYSNADRPPEIPAGDNFVWIKIPAKRSIWWSLVAFPMAARRAGARAIHTQYSLSPLTKGRGVTTIHDVSPFIDPTWFSTDDVRRFTRQMPISAKIANHVITVSESSRSEIEQYLPAAKGKISVTYNGPSESVTPVDRDTAKRLISERLRFTGPFVFTLGTRWKRKNTRLAVEAVERLSDQYAHRLIVTGQAYDDETEEPGRRTVWTGYLDDPLVSALYSAADAYLAPSLHEGFGIPLLEAFSCGCPVIASRGGALPEVAGGAAVIVPDFQAQTWADCLTEVLTDPSKVIEMRQKGYNRLADFDWARTAEQTLAIYRGVPA